MGISEEDMVKLFSMDVHYSTAGTAKETGTGLGLSIIKDLVERYDGQIEIESVEGQGTTFTLTLPLAKISN